MGLGLVCLVRVVAFIFSRVYYFEIIITVAVNFPLFFSSLFSFPFSLSISLSLLSIGMEYGRGEFCSFAAMGWVGGWMVLLSLLLLPFLFHCFLVCCFFSRKLDVIIGSRADMKGLGVVLGLLYVSSCTRTYIPYVPTYLPCLPCLYGPEAVM